MNRVKILKKFPYIMMALTLLSCGGPSDLKPRPKTSFFGETSSLFQEGQCESGVAPIETPLEKEVNKLYEQATEFTYQYNRSHYPYLQAPGQVLNLNLLRSSPSRPLILNENLLKADFQKLKDEWKDLLGQSNLQMMDSLGVIAEAKPHAIERRGELNQVHQLVSTLREKVKRYNSQLCNIKELSERKKFDVRPMHEFQKKLKEHGDLAHKEVEKELVQMCENFNSSGVCQTELLLVKRKKTLRNMKDHYLSLFQKRQDVFFDQSPKTKFQCHKDEEKTVLLLPIEKNEVLKTKLFGSYQALKETIEDKWSNEDIRVIVDFVEGQSNSVKIKWGDSALSFVNESQPLTITMSKSLNFSQLVITLTHEIGHVFGFRDCYHEFYDRKEKSIIYYSLDESGKNLMCNLNFNTSIPDSYLNQLIESNCQ